MSQLCAECNWPRRDVPVESAIELLIEIAAGYREVVHSFAVARTAPARISTRPEVGVWSVAEYLGHAADAMEHIERRVRLLLLEDDPVLDRFGDPNSRDYGDVDTNLAVARVDAACRKIADALSTATPDQPGRTGHNELGTATLASTAAYAVHEAGHHLHDVRSIAARVLA